MAAPQDIVSKYPESTLATHTFTSEEKPIIYMEHYFDLTAMEELGVPIIANMESCGIRGYFNLKESVVPGLIKMFYDSILVASNLFQGTVLGIKVDIHPSSIAQAIGCECVPTEYTKQWMKSVGSASEVHKVLIKEGEKVSGTFTYNKLSDVAKIYHQLLNKSILHRYGGKDSVTDVHKFCLYHMVSGEPFNLPSLLYTHWKGTLADRANCVYHTMLLNKIMWDKGVYEKFYTLSEEELVAINARGNNKLLQPITFGKSNLSKMGLSLVAPAKVKAEAGEAQPTKRARTQKTTAPTVQKKPPRKIIMMPSESDEDSDNMPISASLKRKELSSASVQEHPKKKTKLRIKGGKLVKTSSISDLPIVPPVNPIPSPHVNPTPSLTENISLPLTIIPSPSPPVNVKVYSALPKITTIRSPSPGTSSSASLTLTTSSHILSSTPIPIIRSHATISYDITTTHSIPASAPKPKRHPLLPDYFPDNTNIYNLIFPGTTRPQNLVVLYDPSQNLTREQAKQNKIGTRVKPNPHILDKTISILCGLYPIDWPGPYMLQNPGLYRLGYYRPMYSWLEEGANVTDAAGNPKVDAQGNPLKLEAFLSSKPTYGPEYYYLPSPPPSPPSFDILVNPPIFEPQEEPVQSNPVVETNTNDWYIYKHFPALLNKAPHPTIKFQPPPEPLYEEGTYEFGPEPDPSDDRFLPSNAVIPLPPPKYKRIIYPKPVIKTSPWSPPQGTPQFIDRERPEFPTFVPKLQIYQPPKRLLPVPVQLYKSPTLSELAITGSIKLCSELPNQMYIPPSLFTTPSTQILVVPDKICPRLPLLNPQKLKDVAPISGPRPFPTKFEIKPMPKPYSPQDPSDAFRYNEADAERRYHRFMFECSKEAGSSGLSEAEKAETPVIGRYSWTQCTKLYHFSDSSVAFLNQRQVPDLDALSKQYFIHTAMFDLHAYKDEWAQVTNGWCKGSSPEIQEPPSAPPPLSAQPISVAPPAQASEIASSSAPGPHYVTIDQLQELKTEITQQVDAKFDQLLNLLAARFPPRDPPPS